jgi:hypothetical protein
MGKGQFRRWGLIGFSFKDLSPWNNIQNEEWFEFEEHDMAGKYTITNI